VKRPRIESIDVLRGVVMILIALDHVRDYFGAPGNPTDPARASTALFFTRWVTHFCAPVFFLLTGTGAFLARGRTSTPDLSRFLIARGVWLVVLELTLFRCFAYQFNVDYRVTMLVILWALGWSMIGLGLLVRLPVLAVTTFGLALVALHNLFDGMRGGALWTILHGQGVIAGPPHVIFVAYPLVPWIGMTAAGYGLGEVFTWPRDRRCRFLVRAGMAMTAGFVLLRGANVYGDPSRWRAYASGTRTLLSFLNATKYPPSLLFLLMTIGPALLLLAWLDRDTDGRSPKILVPVLTFGRVPLFYFLLHMPLIHAAACVVCWFRYGTAHWMMESPTIAQYPFTQPPGWGYGLPIIYAAWAGVVIGLYPLCRWFAQVKQRHSAWWLSYV
jgi:uncharacterized membrane protein